MDLQIMIKELDSPALQQIVGELVDTLNRLKNGNVNYQQASIEVIDCKHLIQTYALDWAVNKRITKVKKLTNK